MTSNIHDLTLWAKYAQTCAVLEDHDNHDKDKDWHWVVMADQAPKHRRVAAIGITSQEDPSTVQRMMDAGNRIFAPPEKLNKKTSMLSWKHDITNDSSPYVEGLIRSIQQVEFTNQHDRQKKLDQAFRDKVQRTIAHNQKNNISHLQCMGIFIDEPDNEQDYYYGKSVGKKLERAQLYMIGIRQAIQNHIQEQTKTYQPDDQKPSGNIVILTLGDEPAECVIVHTEYRYKFNIDEKLQQRMLETHVRASFPYLDHQEPPKLEIFHHFPKQEFEQNLKLPNQWAACYSNIQNK